MESPSGWTEDLVSDVCDETSVEIAFREEAEALRTASLRLDRDTGEAYEVPPTMTFTGAQADHIVTVTDGDGLYLTKAIEAPRRTQRDSGTVAFESHRRQRR